MVNKDEINAAIIAHGSWKQRLRDLINGKDSDIDPEKAGTDNNCKFGKWLYGDTLSEEDKSNEFYKQVKNMHSEFHLKVKEIIDLVRSNRKEDAEGIIKDIASPYNMISCRLINKLAEWKRAITGETGVITDACKETNLGIPA